MANYLLVNDNIKINKGREGNMKMNDSFFKALLDIVDVGIYVIDQQRRFCYVNRGYLKMTNTSREALNQLPVQELIDKKIVRESASDIVFRQKKVINIVQDVYEESDLGGNYKYSHIGTYSPVFDKDGNVEYVVAEIHLLNDIVMRYQDAVSLPGAPHITQINMEPLNKPNNKRVSIIAESPAMKELLNMAGYIANTDASVLITGPSGSGKEVIANYIKENSNFNGRMVSVNCAAIPDTLLEAELFGYEKGAFTGADPRGKSGLIEQADKGILFLDEINSLPLSLQGKLLRVLETGNIRKVGSVRDKHVEFKLITASNVNLKEMVDNNQFREDLYYRINVIPLKIPPLKERVEDIAPLGRFYIRYFCQKYSLNKMFGPNVFDFMNAYEWPGNVRELRNFVERMLITSMPDVHIINQVPEGIMQTLDLTQDRINCNVKHSENVERRINDPYGQIKYDEDFSLQAYMDNCEKTLLQDALKKYKTTYRVAEVLKINQSNVVRKRKKYGL